MADSQHQHFCLRWNNYQSSITSAFENLRDDEDFVDVTLACDGKSLKAHRVVLSACSPYFRELLKSTPCKHPVIVLQDVSFSDLHALVEFIYHGEVNVHQHSLSSFLKTAEILRVSGLTQHDNAHGPLAQLNSTAGSTPLAHTPPNAPLTPSTPHTPAPHTPGPHTPHPHTPHPHTPHPHTPHPHTPHPHTPSYNEKLEEALSHPPRMVQHLLRTVIPMHPRRNSDNSPDVIKRPRHDNNNTEPFSHMPQSQAADFSIKGHGILNNSRVNHGDTGGNNGNGLSNSSSSPSPHLDDVKNEPLDMICGPNADADRSNDTSPHLGHRSHANPPSRGSSADADDRTPPPVLPPSPFITPNEAKLFAPGNSPYSFNLSQLADHQALAKFQGHGGFPGLQSPGLTPDGMAGTSQAVPPLRMPPPTAGGINEPQECPYCRRTFSCYYSLKRHFQDKHEQSDTLYVCEFCHRRYRTKNSLTTHKSLQHRGSSGMLKRLLKTSALQSALAPSPHHLFDLSGEHAPQLPQLPQLPPGLQ